MSEKKKNFPPCVASVTIFHQEPVERGTIAELMVTDSEEENGGGDGGAARFDSWKLHNKMKQTESTGESVHVDLGLEGTDRFPSFV